MINIRQQFAVGQGGFHAAKLFWDDRILRYVYDCGATSHYTHRLNHEIDDYINKVGVGSDIGILFISHAHADHICGVARLLDALNGLRVKTIILPLLNVEERLIAFAKAKAADAKTAQSAFFRDFTIDPTAALSRFKPDRIIYVRSASRGPDLPGAPGSRDRPGADPSPEDILKDELDVKPDWELIGGGGLHVSEEKVGGASVVFMEDTCALKISSAAGKDWLLAPFVDPTVEGKTKHFFSGLAKLLGTNVRGLKKSLLDVDKFTELVTKQSKKIVSAYRNIESDINVTSLSLYSGPSTPGRHDAYKIAFGRWSSWTSECGRVAWMGTGDAALADITRRGHFLRHYGALLNNVSTLMLPHHGSESNFHEDLVDKVNPQFLVVAADKVKKWRHPGSNVVQSVASAGKFVSVVTSDARSHIEERCKV